MVVLCSFFVAAASTTFAQDDCNIRVVRVFSQLNALSSQGISSPAPRMVVVNDHGTLTEYSYDVADYLRSKEVIPAHCAQALTLSPAPVAPAPPHGASSGPFWLADINGDGIEDVVLMGWADSKLYLSRPDGSLADPVPLIGGVSVGTLADLTGDGILDAIGTLFGYLWVAPGNGDGSFGAIVPYPLERYLVDLAVADLNGDGRPDVVGADPGLLPGTGSVVVLIAKGDGGFEDPVNYAAGSDPSAVVVADFNGDGKLDVAAGGSGIIVLPGAGNGTFGSPLETQTRPVSFLAWADFNRDRRLDLAAVHSATDGVSILLGAGDGRFHEPRIYFVSRFPTSVSVEDLNQDGQLDLIVPADGAAAILLGAPDGTFDAPVLYSAGKTPHSLTVADFDGDGQPDLAVANFVPGQVSVFLGNGSEILPAGQYTIGASPEPRAIRAADIDGDNHPDLVVANSATDDIVVLRNGGDGTFLIAGRYPVDPSPVALLVRDFNNDGSPDVLTANWDVRGAGTGSISVLLNRGDGIFGEAIRIKAGANPHEFAAGDFDRDGNQDLVVFTVGNSWLTPPVPSEGFILLGTGDGTFRRGVSLPGTSTSLAGVADFNNDGVPDPLLKGAVAVLLGNGDGTFREPIAQSTEYSNESAVTGDINGDGLVDVVLSRIDQLSYLLGNGDGTLQPEVSFWGGPYPAAFTFADFNADGRPDLALAMGDLSYQPPDGSVSILLNSFSGPFAPVTHVSAASFQSGAQAAEAIVSAFGTNLAQEVAAARSLPLPTVLAGTSVKVRDSLGMQRLAPLFYVSPLQVNYQLPGGTATGPATVTVVNGEGSAYSAGLQVAGVAPGLFALNSDGLAAATILRVKPGNVQVAEQVFQVVSGNVTASPIDLGPETDQVYLLLYGTGIRGNTSLSGVHVSAGGQECQVTYAGAQGTFAGLDQVNVLLPRSLAGRGRVDITMSVDGQSTNTVSVLIR